MRLVFKGLGFEIKRSFRGGAPGVPIEWQWCLTLFYRLPWALVGPDKELMEGRPLLWCARYFYFGETRTDRAHGYESYVEGLKYDLRRRTLQRGLRVK